MNVEESADFHSSLSGGESCGDSWIRTRNLGICWTKIECRWLPVIRPAAGVFSTAGWIIMLHLFSLESKWKKQTNTRLQNYNSVHSVSQNKTSLKQYSNRGVALLLWDIQDGVSCWCFWFQAASRFPANTTEDGRDGCRLFISCWSCSFRVDTCSNDKGDNKQKLNM